MSARGASSESFHDAYATQLDLPCRPTWEPTAECFEAASGDERARLMRRWLRILGVLMVLSLGLDVFEGIDMLVVGSWARIVFWLPLCAAATALLARRRSLLLEGVIAAVPIVAAVAVVAGLAKLALSPYSERYLAAAGILCFTTNMFSPLLFRQAVLISGVATAAFAAIALSGPDPLHDADFVLFVLMMNLVTALSLRRSEKARKRAFALSVLNDAQAMALERSNRDLMALSITDPLTGVPNRRAFDEKLASAWRNRVQQPIAVAMVDIDHFKDFNDALGHVRGDDCLALVASAIAAVADEEAAFVARFGGEEFVVLMDRKKTVAEALQLTERIRSAVEGINLVGPGGPHPLVTVSIGLAVSHPGLGSSIALVESADRALYAAKMAGRNRVVLAKMEVETREVQIAAPSNGDATSDHPDKGPRTPSSTTIIQARPAA